MYVLTLQNLSGLRRFILNGEPASVLCRDDFDQEDHSGNDDHQERHKVCPSNVLLLRS